MAGLLRLPLGPQTSEQDAADEVQVAHAKEHKEEEAHLASRLAVATGRQGHHENTRPSFVRRARASPGACSSMRRAAPWRRERLRALG